MGLSFGTKLHHVSALCHSRFGTCTVKVSHYLCNASSKTGSANIADCVYNWMADFVGRQTHCTKLSELTSAFLAITAGVIQGSAVGPAIYLRRQRRRPDSH